MCLLDEVMNWDANHLRGRSGTHRSAAHPLLRNGRLGIACGIEYVVQAMAVHGALAGAAPAKTASASAAPVRAAPARAAPARAAPATRAASTPAKPAIGFLAGLRDVRMHATRLDDIDSDLVCDVRRIAGDAATALYSFDLSALGRCLLEGRATVVLDAGGLPTGYSRP